MRDILSPRVPRSSRTSGKHYGLSGGGGGGGDRIIPGASTYSWTHRAVFYDETVYPAPHTYDPERFLKDGKLDCSVNDPEDRIFGSGRRCGSAPSSPIPQTQHSKTFV